MLVLEAGANLSNDPEVLDPNIFDNIDDLSFNPKYALTYPVLVAGSLQTTTYSEGRMWGGSSAHNYLLAVRGTPLIYQQWATISGNQRWTYANLLPTFKAIETYTGTTEDPSQRGTNGPIFLTQTGPVGSTPFADALATAMNAPLEEDYNVTPQGDICTSTWQEFVTPGLNSQRSFSITGYLPNGTMPNPVVSVNGKGLDGRKLLIYSSAHVSNVIFKKNRKGVNRAVGVNFILSPNSQNEKVLNAYARKKIILCAGGIHTSAILQRSGVGDQALLGSFNIPVIVPNSNVGQNLSNQYGPSTAFDIPDGNPQFIQSFATGFPFYPNDGVRRMQFIFFPGVIVGGNNFIAVPKARGSVTIVSTDPSTYPKINLNMFGDSTDPQPYLIPGTDAYTAVSMLKLARNAALAAGGDIIQPSPSLFADDALLFEYAQSNPGIGVSDHITGTTRMADSAATGVVDGNLHVFGVKDLMIADLGIAPYQPDGNPCFVVFAIASQAADIILSGQ